MDSLLIRFSNSDHLISLLLTQEEEMVEEVEMVVMEKVDSLVFTVSTLHVSTLDQMEVLEALEAMVEWVLAALMEEEAVLFK